MIHRMTYTFEEIPVVLNGEDLYASGDITVSYEIFEIDTTVGIIRPDIEIDGFSGATFDLVDAEGDMSTVYAGVGSDLWTQIVAGINHDFVIEEIAIYEEIS